MMATHVVDPSANLPQFFVSRIVISDHQDGEAIHVLPSDFRSPRSKPYFFFVSASLDPQRRILTSIVIPLRVRLWSNDRRNSLPTLPKLLPHH